MLHTDNHNLMHEIYMDNQSTTRTDPLVVEAMLPYFYQEYGNSSSNSHAFGWRCSDAIEDARKDLAESIGGEAGEIIFTSGATEANNLAIKGVAEFYGMSRNKIILSSIEHKCVINSFKKLESKGYNVQFAPVDSDGIVDLSVLESMVDDNTLMVSIMAVNNEIGVIEPIDEIGSICASKGVLFHVDAAQAFGKIPINVRESKISLMSVSGHKIYGPKGVGFLFVSKRPRVRISPLFDGGGQERGMRSGTLPVPLVIGLAKAAELALSEMQSEKIRLRRFFDYFISELVEKGEDIRLNGHREKRIPNNVNLSFSCVEGESLIAALKGVAVSSGSACTSESLETSYVLKAIGVSDELAHTSIRFGMGRFTSEEEVFEVVRRTKSAVSRLREISPLWEMMKNGEDLSKIDWCPHH